MEIITFAVLFSIALILLILGFLLDPINPYLILFSSMFLFLIAASMLDTGLQIPNGVMTSNLTINSTAVTGNLIDVKETPSRFISAPLTLIILLFSLYLAYFSIDQILGNKYGESNVF